MIACQTAKMLITNFPELLWRYGLKVRSASLPLAAAMVKKTEHNDDAYTRESCVVVFAAGLDMRDGSGPDSEGLNHVSLSTPANTAPTNGPIQYTCANSITHCG